MTAHYTVEKLPDEPIILSILFPQYSVARDMPESDNVSRAILDATDHPLFIVADTTQISFTLEDVLLASSQGARGQTALWHHPMLREFVLVSTHQSIKLAARGLNSQIFGNLAVKVFDTLEEALAYCRKQTAVERR